MVVLDEHRTFSVILHFDDVSSQLLGPVKQTQTHTRTHTHTHTLTLVLPQERHPRMGAKEGRTCHCCP